MSINLLLVENNDSTMKMVELTFENEDVDVAISSNGDEAFNKILKKAVDIVVADIDSNGLSGLDLCKKIKENPALNMIPVLILANSSDDFNEEKMKDISADGFIVKPFKSDELISKVSQLTGKKAEGIKDNSNVNKGENEVFEEEPSDSENTGQDDAVLKLDLENEITDEDMEDITRSVEIFPEEILEDDEKDIDFSDILGDDEEEVEHDESYSVLSGASISDEFTIDEQKDTAAKNKNVKPETFMGNSKNAEDAVGEGLNKAVLSKLLGDQMQHVLEKIIKEVTKDALRDAVEKSIKQALEESFTSMSPRIVKIIEDISWEIIPDLAEVLIKKEIEKLKKSL